MWPLSVLSYTCCIAIPHCTISLLSRYSHVSNCYEQIISFLGLFLLFTLCEFVLLFAGFNHHLIYSLTFGTATSHGPRMTLQEEFMFSCHVCWDRKLRKKALTSYIVAPISGEQVRSGSRKTKSQRKATLSCVKDRPRAKQKMTRALL